MDTTKQHFIERVNNIGVLTVRERNSKEDLTGLGSLEFILNNGEIFIISGKPFGQGPGEDGLWVDMNMIRKQKVKNIIEKVLRIKKDKKEDPASAWARNQGISL